MYDVNFILQRPGVLKKKGGDNVRTDGQRSDPKRVPFAPFAVWNPIKGLAEIQYNLYNYIMVQS